MRQANFTRCAVGRWHMGWDGFMLDWFMIDFYGAYCPWGLNSKNSIHSPYKQMHKYQYITIVMGVGGGVNPQIIPGKIVQKIHHC